MPLAIRVRVGEVELEGRLEDTACARAVAEALPLTSSFAAWGDEIYFTVPVEAEADRTATTQPEVGDLCYWPGGRAVCIFFGPTPLSQGEEPVAAGPVNRIGRVEAATRLRRTKEAREVTLEAVG